jgi:Zinc knuckle
MPGDRRRYKGRDVTPINCSARCLRDGKSREELAEHADAGGVQAEINVVNVSGSGSEGASADNWENTEREVEQNVRAGFFPRGAAIMRSPADTRPGVANPANSGGDVCRDRPVVVITGEAEAGIDGLIAQNVRELSFGGQAEQAVADVRTENIQVQNLPGENLLVQSTQNLTVPESISRDIQNALARIQNGVLAKNLNNSESYAKQRTFEELESMADNLVINHAGACYECGGAGHRAKNCPSRSGVESEKPPCILQSPARIVNSGGGIFVKARP